MYFEYRADLVRHILMAVALTAMAAPTALAQGDWPIYGGDGGNTRYSPLTQITPTNVSTLKQAWTWDSGESASSFQVTPLVIGHAMYVSTPRQRVVALDADTGKEIWSFDPKLEGSATHRGVTYWAGDRQNPARVIVGTTEGQIYALDARTGVPIASFGKNGVVDYRAGFADKFPHVLYGFSSPPAVYRDLIIFGPRTAESGPKGPDASIRALDVRTGKEVWTFHTLPRPGEPGYETWGPDFWKDGAGPSAWAGLTVDKDRGMVFVPVGNPTGGGDPAGRKGNNLYSDSVVALNAETGKLIWYYQMVHHDTWDYDVPASPTLLDVVQNGKTIPAVAEITKNGLLFILNRITGQPVFGAEERPVPAGKTPGDELSPTQPFPLKPVPLARNSMSTADISHISPASESFCAELVASHDVGGPFIPRGGANGTITFPSSVGGGNWGGVSYDPSLHLISAASQTPLVLLRRREVLLRLSVWLAPAVRVLSIRTVIPATGLPGVS
jgi:glucose dehydrogenase